MFNRHIRHIRYLRNYVITLILFSLSTVTSASVVQVFFANNYMNPADLNLTKNFQFKAGANWAYIYNHFDGTVFGNNGSASTNELDVYPYFLIAKRVLPQVTIGLNVSNPYIGDFEFPENTVVAPATTRTIVHDVDFNPLISYKVNDQLTIGGGVIFNNFAQLELDFVQPPFGNIVNHFSAWSYGWDVGLSYAVNENTFLGAAYFSKLVPHFKGTSVSGFLENTNARIIGFILPATTKLEITHIFCKKWLMDVQFYYSQWRETSEVRVLDVFPFNLDFPEKFRNTITLAWFNKYTLNEKWDVTGLLIFDQGAAPTHSVTINFPATNTYVVKAGGHYHLNKDVEIKLQGGYIVANPRVTNPFGLSIAGSERLRVYSLETELAYNV